MTQGVTNWRIRSHSDVELNCRFKYALILCWHSIHLIVINFQLLNLAFWFDIWKGLNVAHAVFGRFVNHISAFHISSVLDLTSTLNWFDSESLKLQHGGYLFNDEMIRQILVKTRKHIGRQVHQRHQEGVISSDSNYKISKAHWVCISYSDPHTHSWFLDLLFWLRGFSTFLEK